MDHPDTPQPPSPFKAICALLARLGHLQGFQPPAQAIFDRRAGEHAAKTGLRPEQLSLAEIRTLAEASASEYADQLSRSFKP